MVIEHTFVTAFSSGDALSRVSQYLSAKGFALDASETSSFEVAQPDQPVAWTALQMRRGKKRAARARNVIQLPQVARVEWNRGRVTVALSIAANSAWGGAASFSVIGDSQGKPKKMTLHIALLKAIAVGIERLLAYNGPKAADYAEWDSAERDILAAAKKRFVRNMILLLAIFGFVAFMIFVALTRN